MFEVLGRELVSSLERDEMGSSVLLVRGVGTCGERGESEMGDGSSGEKER